MAVFIADAGVAAGSTGAIKSRAEHGASKDQSDFANEHGEDFEQLVAGGDKASRGGEANAKSDIQDVKSRPSMRLQGAAWQWPVERAVGTAHGEGKASGKGQAEDEDAAAEPLHNGPRATVVVSSEIADSQPRGTSTKIKEGPAAEQLNLRSDKLSIVDGNDVPGRAASDAGGAGQSSGASAARGRPSFEGAKQSSDGATHSALGAQAGRTAPQVAGVAMQPGMVEPAVVQLAAVLAQSGAAGKAADGARGISEAPKIQVSLAETHFSPVKPDSELEAFDLVRRMDGVRPAEDPGRSLRDNSRLQGDVKAERSGRGSSQRDVRAEQLVQNVLRGPTAGDIGGQIGTRILQELEQSRPAAETRSAGPVHVKQSDPVLKVLEIRLEPRELGTVLVRMSLRDNVLQIELGFGKSDAAATIAKNTDLLTQHLRSSGYVVDDIVVRIIDSDRAPVVNVNPGSDPGQSSAGSSAGSASSSASGQTFEEGSEQRQPAQDGQSPHENSGEGPHGEDNSQHRSDSGLFV